MAAGLVVKGGRVVDPGRNVDRVGDVAFAEGRVAETAPADARVIDATGDIVVPGMIDMHAHVYWGGTSLGIDGDALARKAGTTTWLDVGSAGAGNFEGFRRHVIEHSQTRIYALLHVSFAGIYAFSKEVMVGESRERELLEPKVCAKVAMAHRDLIRGIKVRIGARTSGTHGLTPLHLAIEAADRAGLPVMCHIDDMPPTYSDVCRTLRPGDVLTHCFRPFPNAPCDAEGRVREAVLDARERGVLFDVAHGYGSFTWATAKAMIQAGFLPDIISSDVHSLCIDGPAYDNLVTMEKLLHLGMSLSDVVRAVTVTPARWMRLPELADLAPGSVGDAVVLREVDEPRELVDVQGFVERAPKRLEVRAIVLGGELWHEAP